MKRIESKKLTKLLLIHWHAFEHELIEFGDINVLCGPNGSGKTTLIDAMNTVLLSNSSTAYNKSGNAAGKRTLDDYLAGTSGEEGQERLREGNFSTIIALEFEDTVSGEIFTAGVVFDVSSYKQKEALYFIYGGEIPKDHFIKGKRAKNRKEVKEQIAEIGRPKTKTILNTTAKKHVKALYARLGGIQEKQFQDVFKNTIAFKAEDLKDVKSFVGEYICTSVQDIDLSKSLQEIRDYEEMERQAADVKIRVEKLQSIQNQYESEQTSKEGLKRAQYLKLRGLIDETQEKLDEINAKITKFKQELSENQEKETESVEKKVQLEAERDELLHEIAKNDVYQTDRRLKTEIEDLEGQVRSLDENAKRARERILHLLTFFKGTPFDALMRADFNSELSKELGLPAFRQKLFTYKEESLEEYAFDLSNLNQGFSDSSFVERPEILKRLSDAFDDMRLASSMLIEQMNHKSKALREEKQSVEGEIRDLESGITPLPEDVRTLQALFKKELHIDLPVLAEICEVRNEKWANVLEGILGKRRYYFVPDERDVTRALRLFDRNKRNLKGYNSGIINTKEFLSGSRKAKDGSLAEEIETKNEALRSYLNNFIGDTMKCETAQELEQYKRAITADGMRHMGGAFFPMNPKDWSKPLIGQEGRKRRLNALKEQLTSLNRSLIDLDHLKKSLEALSLRSYSYSYDEAHRAVDAFRESLRIPQLRTEIEEKRRERDALDMNAVEAMQNRLRIIKKLTDTLDRTIKDLFLQRGQLQNALDTNEGDKQKTGEDLISYQREIDEAFDPHWALQIGEKEYQKARRNSRAGSLTFSESYTREITRLKNLIDQTHKELVAERKQYIQTYNVGYSEEEEDNASFTRDLKDYRDNQLPRYQKNFESMKVKAEESMREDYISKIRHNIEEARARIQDHNKILNKVRFGTDMYRFTIAPRPEYKQFYDMIMSDYVLPAETSGPTLFTQALGQMYPEQLQALFRLLLEEERRGGNNQYKDYRTFLDFDIEIQKDTGNMRKLSKVQGKLSGGETQAPYYVSMISSLASVYRTHNNNFGTTVRLAVFDEAFSKMDAERTDAAIRLLRDMSMQSLIVAPLNKARDLITYVDRVYVLASNGKYSTVETFTKEGLKEVIDEDMFDEAQ